MFARCLQQGVGAGGEEVVQRRRVCQGKGIVFPLPPVTSTIENAQHNWPLPGCFVCLFIA